MVLKFFNALLFGALFVMVPDFLLFTGLQRNYFDRYGIDIYFNTLFVDNQIWPLFLLLAIATGYAMLYLRKNRLYDWLYTGVVLLSLTTLYPPVGKTVGERLFMQKGVEAEVAGEKMIVDILYRGRGRIYLKKPQAEVATAYDANEVKLL